MDYGIGVGIPLITAGTIVNLLASAAYLKKINNENKKYIPLGER